MNYYQWEKITSRITEARDQALEEIRRIVEAEGQERVDRAKQELDERVSALEHYLEGEEFHLKLQEQIDRAIDSAAEKLAVELMRSTMPQLISVRLDSFTRSSEIARLESKLATSYEFVREAVESKARECDKRYEELRIQYAKLTAQCDRLRALLKQARVSLPSDDGVRVLTTTLERRL